MGQPAAVTAKTFFLDLDLLFARAERPDIPLTPVVAMALRRAAGAERPNLREMVKVLAMDPLLCGQLLRAARQHQPEIKVRALRDAAAVLGTAGVLEVIRAATTGEVFRVRHYGACFTSVGQHARATGSVAYVVSRHTGVDGREAYLGGLLHEVGFAAALAAAAEDPPPITDAWNGLEIAGRHATCDLLQRWGVDGALSNAVCELCDDTPALSPMLSHPAPGPRAHREPRRGHRGPVGAHPRRGPGVVPARRGGPWAHPPPGRAGVRGGATGARLAALTGW